MKNHIQSGNILTLTAPAALVAGNIAVIGSLFGVVASSVQSGQQVDLYTQGVYAFNKVGALAIAVGDKVYWDSATSLVTKTASGNTYIGVAVTAAANPSSSVQVRLNGSF